MKTLTTVARLLVAYAAIALAGAAIAQQSYPTRQIRLIVPFTPGGNVDPLARIAAQKLAERWGQPVIVENRPGGNSIIGTDAVAKAPADGYTVLVAGSPHVIGASLLTTPYDAIKDFDAIATIAKSRQVLVLNPSVPANNLREIIALAKSRPGQLDYASVGTGSLGHLGMELFSIMADVKLQHIPYKGGGPAVTALIGGQVQLSFQIPIAVIAQITSGKLKAIAITGEKRMPTLAQVPTFSEAGLPGYELAGWTGMLAPAGTPRAIIDKMSNEMAKILVMPDISEKLVSQGMEPLISTPEQFASMLKTELAKFAEVIKTANIRVEN